MYFEWRTALTSQYQTICCLFVYFLSFVVVDSLWYMEVVQQILCAIMFNLSYQQPSGFSKSYWQKSELIAVDKKATWMKSGIVNKYQIFNKYWISNYHLLLVNIKTSLAGPTVNNHILPIIVRRRGYLMICLNRQTVCYRAIWWKCFHSHNASIASCNLNGEQIRFSFALLQCWSSATHECLSHFLVHTSSLQWKSIVQFRQFKL